MYQKRPRPLLARLITFGLILFFTSFGFVASASATDLTYPVAIGEINWAGSQLSTADEWLELWNTSDQSLDLTGYSLQGTGGGTNGIVFASTTIIAPYSTLLIANYAALDPKSVLEAAPDLVTTTLSLANDHLLITLLDPQGNVVDQAGDGSTPFSGASLPTKISMQRQMPVMDGSLIEAWESATLSSGFDPNMESFGTPGFCAGCLPAPNEPEDAPTLETVTSSDMIVSPEEPPTIISSSTETAVPVPDIEPEQTATTTIDMTDTTSTPSLPPPETPTAETVSGTAMETPISEPIITEIPSFNESATTSTEVTPLINEAYTEATSTTLSEIPLTTSSTQIIIEISTTSTPPVPLLIHLHRLMANPSSGPEWIELKGLGEVDIAQLFGWSLEDAVSTVFSFNSSTVGMTERQGDSLRALLTGSHLNNGGDVVSLRNPQGEIVEKITYDTLDKDEVWPRVPPIQPAPIVPTPIIENVAPPVVTTSVTQKTETKIETKVETKTSAAKPPTKTLAAAPNPKSMTTTKPTTKTPTPKTTPKAVPKKTAAAPKAKKVSVPQNPLAPHVQLSGVVASIPGLLAQNRFVIQTEDGRGLLVKGNGKQPSPAFGALVQLTGTLVTNDQGTTLNMAAKDSWKLLGTQKQIEPRLIDLFNPSKEDAWSLINVTGTVLEAKQGLIRIDTDDATLTIKVRPVVRYRAQRLEPGDMIRVMGLFEPKDDEPFVYPRYADEIVLLTRAPSKEKPPVATQGLPPWMPFGAAGATVAVTQGYKRVQKLRERRRLETALAKASQNLNSFES